MKKILVILLSLALLSSFTSCITVKNNAELQRNRDEIEAIEIYCLEEIYHEESLHVIREENTPVYTLKENQQKDFLDKLCQFEYEKKVILAPIPFDGACNLDGYVVSVVYNDGKSYELFGTMCCFSYLVDENGKVQYGYDHADLSSDVSYEDWSKFIESYIEE